MIIISYGFYNRNTKNNMPIGKDWGFFAYRYFNANGIICGKEKSDRFNNRFFL